MKRPVLYERVSKITEIAANGVLLIFFIYNKVISVLYKSGYLPLICYF